MCSFILPIISTNNESKNFFVLFRFVNKLFLKIRQNFFNKLSVPRLVNKKFQNIATHEVISTSMGIMKSLFATISFLFLANLNHTLAAKNVIMPKGQDLKIFSGNGVYQFKEKDNYAEVAEIISEELNIFCYNGTYTKFPISLNYNVQRKKTKIRYWQRCQNFIFFQNML